MKGRLDTETLLEPETFVRKLGVQFQKNLTIIIELCGLRRT